MSSSIRNIRDLRNQVRPGRDTRGPTESKPTQSTYDKSFTAHSTSSVPPAMTGEPSKTDHKVDQVHQVIRDQLAPRIQTLSANAVLSDRREFYHYHMRRSGRRCSCYTVENSPNKICPICLGVGVVGGYEKFGTITEIIDYTTPDLLLVNVEPTLAEDTRPVNFRLQSGFNKGYVEGTIPLRQNIGMVDTYLLRQPIFNRGTRIIAIDPLGNSATIERSEDWTPFLAFDRVRVRIEMERIDEKAVFSNFLLRYKTAENAIIFGDIPRAEENLSGTQFGFYDAYQEISVFFDSKTITRFQNEDILIRLYDNRRFKIVMVNQNVVAGTNTSTDVRARYLIDSVDSGLVSLLV